MATTLFRKRSAASTFAAAAIFSALLVTSATALVRPILSPEKVGLGGRREKLSHLHFYFHDTVSGRDPTAVAVVAAANGSSSLFGMVVVIDDPLTVGPETGSKLVGRAQGVYGGASQTEIGLLMVMNFAFVEGKYNGSYLSILGRNTVASAVREMPVVGGGGLFRFACGYAQANTHTFNYTTGNAVVEYNVYVFHY